MIHWRRKKKAEPIDLLNKEELDKVVKELNKENDMSALDDLVTELQTALASAQAAQAAQGTPDPDAVADAACVEAVRAALTARDAASTTPESTSAA